MLFDVFKNGCRVEALQLSTIERVECALALYLIVAWRIAHLMRMGRSCPDMDARLLFDREEVQAAYLLGKKPLPKSPPPSTKLFTSSLDSVDLLEEKAMATQAQKRCGLGYSVSWILSRGCTLLGKVVCNDMGLGWGEMVGVSTRF